MKQQNSKAWRRAVVPAAFAAAIVAGAAGPALAEPGSGQAQGHGHSGSVRPATSTTSENGDGATTFSKPNSWQAQADPDGMTNGGVDQPGGTGGTVGAQDGNNGSGNDPDCEDDNRGVGIPGHCKTKPHAKFASQGVPEHQQPQPAQAQSEAAPGPAQPVAGSPAPGSTVPGHPEQAQGLPPSPVEQAGPVVIPATQVVPLSAVRPQDRGVHGEVAGLSASRQPTLSAEPALLPSAQTLPNTGAPGAGVPLAAAGALLVTGGAGLMLRRRSAKAAAS